MSLSRKLILEIIEESKNNSNNLKFLFSSEHHNGLYYSLSNDKVLTGTCGKIYNEIIIAVTGEVGEELKKKPRRTDLLIPGICRAVS